MKEQINTKIAGRKLKTSFFIGLLSLGLAVFYPNILAAFLDVVSLYGSNEAVHFRIGKVLLAIVLMSLTFLIPILAFSGIRKVDRRPTHTYPKAIRRILHFAFATPPFYTISVLVTYKSGVGHWHPYLWYGITTIVTLLFFYFSTKGPINQGEARVQPLNRWWRLGHGIAALLIIMAFVLFHLSNHLLALISVEWHTTVMEFFRRWYRADFVEPFLLGIFLILLVSGIRMVWHYTQNQGDFYRTLQTCSGFYLSVFLCTHVMAVFVARLEGVDTDWVFAVGPDGLLYGFIMLFPYYTLATFLVLVHASLGLRQILKDKNWDAKLVNRLFYGLLWVSIVVSVLISMATMGLKLQKESEPKHSQTIINDELTSLINSGELIITLFKSHMPTIQARYTIKQE